jgi:glycosyltransferase involved in cell wall biosynthesis
MIKSYSPPTRLESVSIILPVVNETVSLQKTIETILRDVKRELIREFIIVVCKRTTPEAMAVVAQIQKELGELVVLHEQKMPFLGGAMREAFNMARGTHLIMMASDLETDPKEVAVLIAEAVKNPAAIITASRWQTGVQFHGYSKIKLACNWLFQRMFSMLYATSLSDLTFAYRIFPTKLVQVIRWEDFRHSFLFETLVKPLRLGVPVIEIPSTWRARTEGVSQNTFFRNFEYFKIGLRTRFASKQTLLLSEPVSDSQPEKELNAKS